MEAPDGRVLLYDAGTITGPEVVRRTIAPFLWERGIRRIDEVFLSHADLDHYNGLPALMERFPVGQVTLTPSFREKPIAGVAETVAAIERHRVPLRVAKAGDQFRAGPLLFDVLHPPDQGPAGNENARSLVLLVHHGGHSFLLTGDLEGAGQEMVRGRPLPGIDVMLAPHHGAVSANAGSRDKDGKPTPGIMAAWARPRFVVSSQGPKTTDHLIESYGAVGATVWDTSTSGAVTVRSNPTGIVAESFRTAEVRVVKRGK
jgi:competence protein ComEC